MERYNNENWWVSEYNYSDEVRKGFNLPAKVIIHDATLRDGEQMPGIVFRKQDKIEIAKRLDAVGVQRIEAGMPAVSQEDYEAIQEISKLGLSADIFVFCRANVKDVEKAVECGADGVVIEAPSSVARLKYQFGWTEDEVIKRSIEAVKYAKEKGLKVTYFPYDTTRAELPFLKRLVKEVVEKGGADSTAIIDTLGVALPQTIAYLVKQIKEVVNVPIEVHTHNDMGLGVATTMAAVEAGAEVIHVCVNGLGERTGNTALEEVSVALKMLMDVDTGIRFDMLYDLSKFVEERSGVKIGYGKPIVGDVSFTREIGLGMEVIKKKPTAILPLRPEFVGREFRLVLGKKSGKPSIHIKLEQLGLEATEEQVEELLAKVKALGIEQKRYLTDDEWVNLTKEVLG